MAQSTTLCSSLDTRQPRRHRIGKALTKRTYINSEMQARAGAQTPCLADPLPQLNHLFCLAPLHLQDYQEQLGYVIHWPTSPPDSKSMLACLPSNPLAGRPACLDFCPPACLQLFCPWLKFTWLNAGSNWGEGGYLRLEMAADGTNGACSMYMVRLVKVGLSAWTQWE